MKLDSSVWRVNIYPLLYLASLLVDRNLSLSKSDRSSCLTELTPEVEVEVVDEEVVFGNMISWEKKYKSPIHQIKFNSFSGLV